MGTCALGPVILVQPDGVFYTKMDPEKVENVVLRHLVNNEICEEYTYFDDDMGIHVPKMENIGFFEGQVRIALRNCGQMEFSSFEAYVARDGYAALDKACLLYTSTVCAVRGWGSFTGFSCGQNMKEEGETK